MKRGTTFPQKQDGINKRGAPAWGGIPVNKAAVTERDAGPTVPLILIQ